MHSPHLECVVEHDMVGDPEVVTFVQWQVPVCRGIEPTCRVASVEFGQSDCEKLTAQSSASRCAGYSGGRQAPGVVRNVHRGQALFRFGGVLETIPMEFDDLRYKRFFRLGQVRRDERYDTVVLFVDVRETVWQRHVPEIQPLKLGHTLVV
jgi:hypothetical protein